MTESNKENQVLRLVDGRNLGYAESGDLNGTPIFHFHGLPGSRIGIRLFSQKAKELGIRMIGIDRPGLGLSDFTSGRTLLSWPDDVIELADHLGLDKFIVEGISGGGPYALACAYKIHERLICCGVISGAGPRNWSRKGMMRSNRIGAFIARRLPFLLKPLIKAEKNAYEDEETIKKTMKKMAENLPEPDMKIFKDSEVINLLVEEAKEAFRSGLDGIVDQEKISGKPWGFDLGEINSNLQVYVWHGDMDVFVPSSNGRKFCELIPNCKGFFYPDEGHLSLCVNNLDEILKTLTS